MFGYDDSRVLSDIAGRFRRAVLDEERTEAAQRDVFLAALRPAHLLHELLHDSCDRHALNAGSLGHLFYNFLLFVIVGSFFRYKNS